MWLSNPGDRRHIIFNILNYGTDEASKLLRERISDGEIKENIKNSYASAWRKGSLKKWADFYKVCPKYRHKMEDVLKDDPDKDKLLASIDDNWWPYGGHTIWEEIKKYRG